jgi:hypothetical protein
MDTCQWLLEHGIDPDRIRWIRPRDLWLLNREHYQGGQFVTGAVQGAVLQLEAAARSDDLDGFFERCGESKVFLRLDPNVRPSMIRGATSHEREMALLRTIEQVIRLGHVERIEADRIVLERGEVPTSSGWLHVHCAAEGVPRKAPRAIFQADKITMQHVRLGSPSFSYGLIGFLEASGRDDTEKNRLCFPNAFVHTARDWVRSTLQTFACQMPWRQEPDLAAWLDNRLNLLQGRADAQNTPEGKALGQRFSAAVGPGIASMQRLLAGASAVERALFWPPATGQGPTAADCVESAGRQGFARRT